MHMKGLSVSINIIKDIRPDACHCILRKMVLLYFSNIVNEFTYNEFIPPPKKVFNTVSMRLPVAVPLRTIRRVHVMPWATPAKRIGKTRKGYLCPDDYVSYKENHYRNGAWFLSPNDIVDFIHFHFITSINKENSKAFSLFDKKEELWRSGVDGER